MAERARPVLLLSGDKDSIALLRVAEKAFRPLPLPSAVLHVDTGHNFPEVIEFRDRRLLEAGHRLIVAPVQASIDSGRVKEDKAAGSRNRLQTVTLLDALEKHGFDAAFGGSSARRRAGASEGAGALLPRRVRTGGAAGAASVAVDAVQRADPAW